METLCRDCTFRVNDESGKQISCELVRLEKFIELKQARFDQKTDSYIIERFCNTCRNLKWAQDNPLGRNTILEDIAIDYGAIIEINNKYDFGQLNQTISSLMFQRFHPKVIVVVYHSQNGPSADDREGFREIAEHCNVKFTINYAKGDQLNEGVVNCDTQYYMWLKQGDIVPPFYSQELNDAINTQLKQFIIAKKRDIFVISRLAHDIYRGNTSETIIEKITKLAEEQGRLDMILEL